MRYLLDTCAFLWLALGDSKLSLVAQAVIADRSNVGYLSVVSLWEISMKSVTGKLTMPLTPSKLARRAEENGLTVLNLSVSHIDRFNYLPAAHRDAFDRLLAAVALDETLTFISPDSATDALGIDRAW